MLFLWLLWQLTDAPSSSHSRVTSQPVSTVRGRGGVEWRGRLSDSVSAVRVLNQWVLDYSCSAMPETVVTMTQTEGKPESTTDSLFGWININYGYFRTPPGIIKLAQAVSLV